MAVLLSLVPWSIAGWIAGSMDRTELKDKSSDYNNKNDINNWHLGLF